MSSLALALVAPPRLTRGEIERIVAVWQDRMRLGHWQVDVDWSKPPEIEDTLANCSAHGPYDFAKIRFSPEYPTWERRFANLVVVHELMHLVTRDLEYAAEAGEQAMPTAARPLFKSRIEHEVEAVVDKAATVLVDLGGVV
jgi:hypothetical protein